MSTNQSERNAEESVLCCDDLDAAAIDTAFFWAAQAQQQSNDPEVISAMVIAAGMHYQGDRFVDGCDQIASALRSAGKEKV